MRVSSPLTLAVAILALAACTPRPTPAVPEWETVKPGDVRVNDVFACVSALTQAANAGGADPDTVAMQMPWQVEQRRGAVNPRVVRCAVRADHTTGMITAQVLCADGDDPACSKPIELIVDGERTYPR